MTPQEFMDNFGTLADAPGGIKELRELVLELAVLGRLSPGSSQDDAASQVKACQAALVKKVNGRSRILEFSAVVRDEQPAIPEGWSWARLGSLAEIVGGTTKGRDLKGRKVSSYPYLRVANVQRGFLDLEVMKEIEIPVEELEKYRLLPGDVLFTEGGDWDKLGRSVVWNGEINPCIHQNHVFRARLALPDFEPRWFAMYANSPVGRAYFMDAAKQTTNLASINATQLRACPVPMPSAGEQKRIVARVDQLMALLDDLEAKQGKRQHTVTRATTACLDALTTADSPEEVAAAWKRVARNWRVLFDRPEAVGELRGVVRDLGCNGNLTNRKRFDITGTGQELLSDLLRRRRLTRARLMGQKAGGRQLPAEARIDPSGFAATLHVPNSWDVCGLDDLAACKPNALKAGPFGSALTKQMYVAKGYKVYGQEQVISGDHTVGHYYISPDKFESLKSCAIAPGDILISLMGTIGKVLILPDDCSPGIINPRLLKLSLDPGLFAPFVKLYLESPRARRIMGELAHGIAMDNLNLGTLRVMPFPLPPLEEQRSIVAKVDQLMAACDALESALRRRDDRAGRLVAAVVGEVVG